MKNKGNFMIEALIAVAAFAIYSLVIFNMLVKNIYLSEELDYIKNNVCIIENIKCISNTSGLKNTMKAKNEVIYYIDKNTLNISGLFLNFDTYILKSKPNTDEYIKLSLIDSEVQIEVYGEIYGKSVVMKAVA
ncbi:hypothetical protein [Clostridium cellulovorans]|uniref:Uncharacterized protein n=1 Tax=Clostridium cellulovorans (strain ATCC 35296 / DSM 3052 / OCM 3 / 743B) TaxID=573061 RepID=D9SLE5_CLOC7|nr:hypothetical protein [Clostridium cellulovorans]ADL51661.1 hypothetical protein Clocel_1917 [Clostridium cellulovorans 743B]